MAAKRTVTLRHVQGQPFRLYVPEVDDYRDFDGGILSTDTDDKAFDALMKFAEADPSISIFEAEAGTVKEGQMVCPVCGEPVANEKELAQHTTDKHVEDDDDEGKIRRAMTRRSKG